MTHEALVAIFPGEAPIMPELAAFVAVAELPAAGASSALTDAMRGAR